MMRRGLTPLFAGATVALVTACAGHGTMQSLPTTNASELSAKPQTLTASSLRLTEFPVPHSSTDTISSAIALGPDGNLWFSIFTAQNESKIGQITPEGRIKEFTVSAPLVRGIIIGPDHNLWFIAGRCAPLEFGLENCGHADVGRITTSGSVSLFPLPQCSTPMSLTAGPNDNLWLEFGQFKPYQLGNLCVHGEAFMREMTTAAKIVANFPNPDFCCIFTNPSPIAYGPDRNLWIANYDSIVRMTARGSFTSFPVRNGSAFATLSVPGDESSVWFAENFGIGRITTSGAVTQFSDPNAPDSLAAGPGGIWFTNSFSNDIGRITSSGVISEFAVPNSISPVGIVAGPSATKRMWFVDANFKIGTFATP